MKQIAWLEMTFAMILVGSSIVVGKLLIAEFPIFFVSTIRMAIGFPILALISRSLWPEISRLTRRDWLILFFQALTGIFLFNVLLLYALNYTTAAESGILTSTTPAMIGVISWIFLREKLTVRIQAGIGLTVVGILAMNWIGTAGSYSGSLRGNTLVIAAVIGEALFTILPKATSRPVPSLLTATLISGFGLFLFLPFGIYEAAQFAFNTVKLSDILIILYYSISVTVVAYVLWFSGIAKVPASTAAAFTGILPLSVMILSFAILGESIGIAHGIGTLFVLAGIGLITR